MTDEHDALVAEYEKEKEIASGGNPSEYHKKRFESLKKELGKNTPKPKKEESTTISSTVSDTSDSGTS
jgi:hypothetical protein